MRVSWGSDTDFKKGPGPHTQEDYLEEERILIKQQVAKNSLLDGRLHGHRAAVASAQGMPVRRHGGVRA